MKINMLKILIILLGIIHASNVSAIVYSDAGEAFNAAKSSNICGEKKANAPNSYTGASSYSDENPDQRGTGGVGAVIVLCGLTYGGNEYSGAFGYQATCQSKNSASTAILQFKDSWPACHSGCSVQDSGYVKNETVMRPAGAAAYTVSTFTGVVQYGGICGNQNPTLPPPPDKEQEPENEPVCNSFGTLTQCVKPNGEICALGASGNYHCWDPAAPPATPQTSTDQSVIVNTGPVAPATPAGNTPVGNITNTNTTNTGGSVNITVSSASTSTPATGGTGGDGNTGGTGGNTGGTGGNTGGTTGGTGNCTAGNDCTGAGAAGQGLGTVYTRKTDTISSVAQSYFDHQINSPIVLAVGTFLGTNCALSGECPAMSWDTQYIGIVSTDAFCSPTGALIMQWASYLLLAVAAFAAFRVGFDN